MTFRRQESKRIGVTDGFAFRTRSIPGQTHGFGGGLGVGSKVAEPEQKKEQPMPSPILPTETPFKKRSFTCKFDDCGKKFLDQSILKEHMSAHGEKQVFSSVYLRERRLWKEVFGQVETQATSACAQREMIRVSALTSAKSAARSSHSISTCERIFVPTRV